MQMRRPLSLLSLVFVLLVICCVYGKEPEKAYLPEEGEKIVLTGVVENKDCRVMYGSSVPVLYVSSAEAGNDRQVMCYMKDPGGGEMLPDIGETVRVSGKAALFREASNPGEFDLKAYYQILNISYKLNQTEILERSGSGFPLKETLFRFRCRCSEILEKIYPEKEASVLKAMLLGDKNGLEEEIKELYQLNGLIHILSISGLHISLLGMAVSGFLKKCRIPLWLRAPAAIGIMWCYGIMTGMGVSTRRAVFMFSLHLAAELLGRTYDMLTALSLAAVLMLAGNPLLVLHSGFLLSFGAVLGIGTVLPWWKEILEEMTGVLEHKEAGHREAGHREAGHKEAGHKEAGHKEAGQKKAGHKKAERKKAELKKAELKKAGYKAAGLVREGCYLSTAITLATLPVLLTFYYVYPVYSLLLNLFVIPLAGFVLGFGIVSLIFGFFLPAAAGFMGVPDRVILWFYETVCNLALKLPNGIKVGGKPEVWQIAVYYGILFFLVIWDCRVRENLKWRSREEGLKRQGRIQEGIKRQGLMREEIKRRGRTQEEMNRQRQTKEGLKRLSRNSEEENRCGAGKETAKGGNGKAGIIAFAIPAVGQWLLVLGMIWLLVQRPFSGFTVTFLDVGQGDCIVMRGENGNCYMVDGGSTSKSKVGKYQILPFLESEGIGELEAVFLTHPDEDHISGVLELMEQSGYGVKINSLILPDASQEIKEGKLLELRRQAAAYGIPVYYIGRGDVLEDKKLKFTCLGPEKEIMTDEVNEISIVLYMEYEEFRMLLTGDVTGASEDELLLELEGREPLTVLKVAHHGSRYSTPQELLELTKPVYAVISAGKDNRYGHPHEELMERLKRQGCHICQTPEGGAVTMQVRNGRIRVEEFTGGKNKT